jgi:hypothetical protein
VIRSRKSTRKLPRRGKISGKGGNIIRQQALHVGENVPTTIVIIATLMATPRKNVGNCIQR